jgi:hypothetical protein
MDQRIDILKLVKAIVENAKTNVKPLKKSSE